MRILYIGDIMGERGIAVVKQLLPKLRTEYKLDVVIAQAENVTEGRGISLQDYDHLRSLGVDFFTGGNWSLHRSDIHEKLQDKDAPILRPANYPSDTIGRRYKFLQTAKGRVLVISLLGHIVGKDADKPMDNPLQTIDAILKETKDEEKQAIIVNFHGDYSSEKRVIGYYLDGLVSAVIGDHWHVPTADAMVLPKGTAHITDVGMCGSLHSSLGVKLEAVIPRWRDGQINRNELETTGPLQFNAVLVEVDPKSTRATSISQIQTVID